MMLSLASILSTGCRHVYQDAHDVYPPSPDERAMLRLDEAREAEERVAEAEEILRRHVRKDPAAERIVTDAARLERLSLDLQRRVASARDAAETADLDEDAVIELNRLDDYARQMLGEAEEARAGKPSG